MMFTCSKTGEWWRGGQRTGSRCRFLSWCLDSHYRRSRPSQWGPSSRNTRAKYIDNLALSRPSRSNSICSIQFISNLRLEDIPIKNGLSVVFLVFLWHYFLDYSLRDTFVINLLENRKQGFIIILGWRFLSILSPFTPTDAWREESSCKIIMPLLEWTICYLAWLSSPLCNVFEWVVKIYWGWEISFTKKSLGGQLHLRYGCKESSETFYCSRNMQNICLVKFYNDSLVAYFLEFFLCVENINLIGVLFNFPVDCWLMKWNHSTFKCFSPSGWEEKLRSTCLMRLEQIEADL